MSSAPTSLPSRYTHRYGILAICCMSLFIASMDATVVNVALPSIGRSSTRRSPVCSGRSTATRS
ncbi:hypothetical protein [Frondihabitans sucicola]|uniref:hypothetical protein n=1 Tax=Frondihabitans sucicola TaxID=1268041 RepID=UPI002573B39F|nr:hypothetical protein [Frondihabitans sucicola]